MDDLAYYLGVNNSDGMENYPNPREISLFQFITYGVLLTTISCLGIVGNVMSVIVLSRPQMHSSINCCLIGLASFDIVVLFVAGLMFGLMSLPIQDSDYSRTFFPEITPYFYALGMIAQTGSVWVTVTVTAERYIAVCHPLRAKFLCTYGRARAYVIVITVFATVYNLPRFWEVDKLRQTNEFNQTEVVVVPSDMRKNDAYISIYIIWMYLFVMYFIPFLTLAVLNGLIWRQVRAANRERQRLSRLQKKEISLAIMLFCVVVVFFICNMLALLVSILEAFNVIVDNLTLISNLLVTVNSSVNFVIYCIFGQKFRRILIRLFCRCFQRRKEDQMEESVYPMPSVNTTETKPLCSNGTSLNLYASRQTIS